MALIRTLVDWLGGAGGGALIDTAAIGIADNPGGRGRGVVALADLAEGAVLAQVPLRLALHSAALMGDGSDDPVLRRIEAALDGDGDDALTDGLDIQEVLLAVALVREQERGAASPLAPYVASLPADCQPDPVRAEHEPARAARQTLHRRLWAAYVGAEVCDEASFCRAMRLVDSRAIFVSDDMSLAMAPFLDMLNHDSDPAKVNARFNEVPGAIGLVVTAPDGIRAGCEVVISYGPKSEEEVYARYGF